MKKLFFLPLLLLVLGFSGCKDKDKDDEPTPTDNNNNNNNNNNGTTYFIRFKVDGTQVEFTNANTGATRGTSGGNQTATYTGSTSGSNPSIEFFINSGIIGMVSGLNATFDENSYSYFRYTNASGTLYSSEYTSVNNDEGVYSFVSTSNYKVDGVIKGTFEGIIRTSNGASSVEITDGEYELKFSN